MNSNIARNPVDLIRIALKNKIHITHTHQGVLLCSGDNNYFPFTINGKNGDCSLIELTENGMIFIALSDNCELSDGGKKEMYGINYKNIKSMVVEVEAH